MKRLPLLSLLLALVAASSFHRPPAPGRPAPATLKNFVYTAYPSDDPSDLGDPDNYALTANDGTEVPFCSGVTHRCAILAEDDGTGRPDFSRPYTVKLRS